MLPSMPLQNPVPDARCSWDSIIHGYIRSGKLRDALHAFNRMQEASIQPAAFTFAALLKACIKLKDAENGSALHAAIAANGLLGTNQVLGNAVLGMYAKCGMLEQARDVFASLPCRDVVTWTALIEGYSSHGYGEEALSLYDRMLHHGVSPNSVTFCCLLKACAGIPAAEKGSELHGQIDRLGLLRSNLYIGNALVNMYARCGMLQKADQVFDDLPVRDSITWNMLISGYVRSERSKEAMDRFEHMQLEGIAPDCVTLCCIAKACTNDQMSEKIRGIEDAIAGNELWKSNPFVGNALVDMYAKRGMLEKAREVFDELPRQDVVSWNALIAGYVDHGCAEEALRCFERMQLDHVAPDTITFSCILKACGSTRAMDEGRQIHSRIVAFGFLEEEHHSLIGSSLIDLYTKWELLGSAHQVFDALTVRDVVTWTALIRGYAQHDEDEEEALELFDRMEAESIAADSITLACILRTCSQIGAASRGMRIHGIRMIGLLLPRGVDSSLVNAILDMYAKCGLPEDAEKAFENASVHDVVSWTTLISGFAQAGELEQVLGLLGRMRSHGHAPDPITFVAVLNACNHGGLVDAGNMFFEDMVRDYGIVPTIEHYTCLVDLLGRSGQLDKAVVAMQEMPFYPSGVMWHAVLGACRKWGNVELARYVFEQALMLDETEIGAYVSMRNIYADAACMLDEEDAA